MEEVLAWDAKGEVHDSDKGEEEKSIEQKVVTRIPEAKLPKGLLHLDESDDKETRAELSACAFTRYTEGLGEAQDSREGVGGKGDEGIIGEQEGNTSGLTESKTDRRQQVDEFHAQEGAWNFSDSEDKAKDKQQAETGKEETKVWTRSECEKAGIKPPPVNQAGHPQSRKSCSTSPKPTSHKIPKVISPMQSPKVSSPKQSSKPTSPSKRKNVATDTLCSEQDPQHQPGSANLVSKVVVHKQTSHQPNHLRLRWMQRKSHPLKDSRNRQEDQG